MHTQTPCTRSPGQRRRRDLVACALMAVLAGPAVAAGTADSSCLIPTRMLDQLDSSASREPANARHTVLRPCAGRLKAQRTNLIYTIGDGNHRELGVGAGEAFDTRLAQALGPKDRLADVWPRRGVLAVLQSVLSGKGSALSGTSGFDGDGKTLKVTGGLLMLEGLSLPLAVYGFDPARPLRLVQGSRSTEIIPTQGRATLSFQGCAPGLARLEQGERQAALDLVDPATEAELLARLNAAQSGDPEGRSLRRALLLQDAEYAINAVAELAP